MREETLRRLFSFDGCTRHGRKIAPANEFADVGNARPGAEAAGRDGIRPNASTMTA
jgi:hypothetical protein